MNAKGVLAALTVALCSQPATADDKDAITKEQVTEVVNLLSDCSGFFTFMATVFGDQPATAEQMKGMARGAGLAAAYVFHLERAGKGKELKPLGDYNTYIEGRAEVNRNRMMALLEQGDTEGVEVEQKRCLDALPMQDAIVQMLRDEMIKR